MRPPLVNKPWQEGRCATIRLSSGWVATVCTFACAQLQRNVCGSVPSQLTSLTASGTIWSLLFDLISPRGTQTDAQKSGRREWLVESSSKCKRPRLPISLLFPEQFVSGAAIADLLIGSAGASETNSEKRGRRREGYPSGRVFEDGPIFLGRRGQLSLRQLHLE